MGWEKLKDEKLVEKGESRRSMLTRRSKTEQQNEIINKVFNNPLLIDKIIKYSIYKPNGKLVDKKAVVATRLVNKTWIQSTSRILKISGDFVISIKLGQEYEVCKINGEPHDNKAGHLLDQFVSLFSDIPFSFESILPIHFIIEQTYFIEEDTTKLRNFLERCGIVISVLSVNYPINWNPACLKVDSWNFPILRDFVFEFVLWDELNDSTSRSNENDLNFLQQIFKRSKNLENFTLVNDDDEPVNISNISLPATIKDLSLCSPLTSNECRLVRKNRLPRLKILNLEIIEKQEEQFMNNILEHFRQQLKSLSLDVKSPDENSNIFIKFPQMAKLEYLNICGCHYALLPEMKYVWHKCIPNVTKLVLDGILEEQFLDFVQGSRFENVKKFTLTLSYPDDDERCMETLSPNEKILREICTSFPNVQKLSLRLSLSEISGLKYLFQNFGQLQKLNLYFDRDDKDNKPSYKLVSSLLGIPRKLAKAVVDKKVKNANIAVDNPESIMNLKDLSSLTLRSPQSYFREDFRSHCYSNTLHKYAFKKMPKLQKIKLTGGFEQEQIFG